MLQTSVCGYLGADAKTQGEQGREFTSFRVAHTDRWTDSNGQQRESTTWVDVILNGKPAVAEYLKAGTLVYASGHTKLRCYSSEKARGFVAGIQISATHIELLGGQTDIVPKRLYSHDGAMHDVLKYYHTDCPGEILTNGRGKQFAVDDNGWVIPIQDAPADVQQAGQQQAGQQQDNVLQAGQQQGNAQQAAEKTTKTKRNGK